MNDKLPLTSNVLFAGRRFFNSRDGSKQLVLVNLTTGERLEDSEEKLNVYGVNLGNFLSRTPSGGYQRVTTLQVQVSIEGNVAVVRDGVASCTNWTFFRSRKCPQNCLY